jgi:hypothetical protein
MTLRSFGLFSVVLSLPAPALACGGFFCNRDQPVDQSGETIVFAIDEEADKVEVHVQIAYQGAAEDFAWVLPAPSEPELFLSTEALFQELERSTAPSWSLSSRVEGTCGRFRPGNGGANDTDAMDTEVSADSDDSDAAGGSGVTIVARQQVGPYESLTLQATSGQVLLDWLSARDFDLPADLGPALDPYLADGGFLVALRLAKESSTGDLAPLGMRYPGSVPVIPIQLTRIAATPDMRLRAYVLSDGRAVPENYLHVMVNEVAIDWFGGGRNYTDLITRAADEAGGHAFATDFAGSTKRLRSRLRFDGDANRLAGAVDLSAFMDGLGAVGLSGTAELLEVLTDCISLPFDAGARPVDIFNCPECFSEIDLQFDPVACAEQVDERLIQPRVNVARLFREHTWITRLTSSVSPAEMTVDPRFVINPLMEGVDQVREAEVVYECRRGRTRQEVPRRLELSDGVVVPLPSDDWMWENGVSYTEWVEDAAVWANRRVEQTSARRPPVMVQDNAEAIGAALRRLLDEAPAGVDGRPEVGGREALGCGCQQGTPAAGWWVLLGLLWRHRRG